MKELLQPLFVAIAILLVGAGVYQLVFGVDSTPGVVIESVTGVVEREGSDGRHVAEVGSQLSLDERLVVGEASQAELAFGENTRLTLQADSSIRVLGASVSGLSVELENGRVQATVRPGGAVLGVTSGNRTVVAENARFSMGVGEADLLGLEVRDGSVALQGVDGVDQLESGKRILVAGDVIAVNGGIPARLLLEVEWPEQVATSSQKTVLRGITEPGAEVVVGGQGGAVRTIADPSGEFALEVPLEEGKNDLSLQAISVMGRRETATSTVVRDSEAPTGRFEIRY